MADATKDVKRVEELTKKIQAAFSLADRDGKKTCDVRQATDATLSAVLLLTASSQRSRDGRSFFAAQSFGSTIAADYQRMPRR